MSHEKEFFHIIEHVMRTLPNAKERFAYETTPICETIGRLFRPPNSTEFLDQDYGDYSEDREMVYEYAEEVRTIDERLAETNALTKLDQLHGTSFNLSADSFKKNRLIRAYAEQLWDKYAIRVRVRGDKVYVIWPPDDSIMKEPIIRKYSIGEVLKLSSSRLISLEDDLRKAYKQRNVWRTIGGAALVLIALCVLRYL